MSIIKKVLATILIAMILLNNMSMLIVYGKDSFDNSSSPQNDEPNLTSTKYIISKEEDIVKRVLPETTIGILKGKFNMPKSRVKVYESKKNLVEVEDEAYVATGMAIKVEGASKIYEISVIGDLNKDGQMGQIELNLLINDIVGAQNDLEKILKESADINGDGQINQIDITVLIRWIVYHELEIKEARMPEAPNINVIQGTLEEEGFYNDKVILEIVAPKDESMELEKITYVMTKKSNEAEENNSQSDEQEEKEIEIKSGKKIELEEDGTYEIKAYSYSKQGYKSVENKLEIKIDKLDKIKPEGILEVTEQTTKSLKVEVKDAKDEQSGIESYTYYIGTKNDKGEYEYKEVKKYVEGQEDQGQNTAEEKLKCSFENLKQDEEYKIVVEIKDKAGNINRIEKNVRTKSMPKIRATDIEIGYSNTNWTKENVEVTIKVKDGVDVGECVLEYSLDGGNTWKAYKAEVKVEISENTNIIVRLTDGENNLEIATGRVSNIDKDLPEGSLIVKEARSNRIVVDVEGVDYTSGVKRYTYYIGTQNEAGKIEYREYTTKEVEQEPRERLKEKFTYEGLEKDTTYYIKVEVEDKAGNKKELFGQARTQKIPALNEQNMKFKKSEEEWTKEDVVVKVEVDEDVNQEEFHLEYSLDGGQSWNNYNPETGIVVDHNTNVDVRLSDGKNAGETNRLTIDNIDKTAPEVRITKKEATSSTIIVEVQSEDTQSGIEKYVYYLGKKNEEGNIEYQKYAEIEENSYVYEELDQNTDYYIKVEVVDKVGNVGKAEETIKTERITDATEVIKLTQDRETWTHENVIVTIEYEKTVYDVEYTIDKEHWKKSTYSGERITIEENTTVYARLTDGKNVGESTSLEITNIDKIIPVVESYEVPQIRSDGFTEELHITDNLSGISSITWYIRKQGEEQYKQEKETLTVQEGLEKGNTDVTNKKTYTELKAGTYEIYAQVFDVSGNKVETEEKQVTLKPVEELNDENTTIIVVPETWTNQNVKVTIETQVKREGVEEYGVEEYGIEYSLDGENYYKYIEPVEVERNGKIYARLTDGKNSGQAISKEITNIDKVKPEVGRIKAVEITSKRIKASINMQDTLSGLGKIEWFYKHAKNEKYTKEEVIYTPLNQSKTGSTEEVIEILDLNEIESGLYSIYAKVYDVAGNMIQTPIIVVGTEKIPTVEEGFTMVAFPSTWTNEEVTVTMILAEGVPEYSIEYSTDGGNSWKTGTSVKLSDNGTVYARLTDGITEGEIKSINISNIDKTLPEATTITEKDVTSNRFTAEATIDDTLSGLAKVEWKYKNSNEQTYKTKLEEYQVMNGNKRGDIVSRVSKLNLENLSSGTYNIYAIVYDVAGNKKTVEQKDIKVKSIPVLTKGDSSNNGNVKFTQTPLGWTNDSVSVTISCVETNYTLQYSTDGNNWYEYVGPIIMPNNGTVHARLTDGTNNGAEAITTVENIDKDAPTVGTISKKADTANTITVSITAKDQLSGLGKIEWYYTKQGQSDYKKIEQEYQKLNGIEKGNVNLVEKEITLQDLDNGTYSIYALVYDVAGNVIQSRTENLATAPIPLGDPAIIMTKTPETWTNKGVTVNMKIAQGITGYKIEYSIDGTNWTIGDNITVGENCTVQARLTDGKANGTAKSIVIDNIDVKTSTVQQIKTKEKTTKSITVEMSMQDELSGIGKIEWNYRNEDDLNYSKREELITPLNGSVTGSNEVLTKTLELTNLDSGTYDIFAKVYDVAGNEINSYPTSVETASVPTGNSAFTMTKSPITWTNGDVTVTIQNNTDGYYVEYSTDKNTWVKGTSVKVESNKTIYARLTDGINKGEPQSIEVDNIDKTKPDVSQIKVDTVTSNSIFTNVNVKDALSGLSKIEWYYKEMNDSNYNTRKEEWKTMYGEQAGKTTNTANTLTLFGLRTGIYLIYAKVYDVAGNVSSSSIQTVITLQVPSGDQALSMTQYPTNWTRGDVTVTLESKISPYVTEYSTNGSDYTIGTSVTVGTNGKVYGRLTDGINSGEATNIEIGNIDKVEPTVSSITAQTKTSRSITAQIEVQDNLSGLGKIEWFYRKTGTTEYKNIGETYTTLEGPDAGARGLVTKDVLLKDLISGSYEIYAEVYDVAGNKKQSATATIETVPIPSGSEAIAMTKYPTTWTNETVTVSMSLTNGVSGYGIEYYTTSGVGWTEGTSVTVGTNCIVYARLTDGLNKGTETSITVDKIDTTNPTVNGAITMQTRTSRSITAQITVQDTESGLGQINWFYKKQGDAQYIEIEKPHTQLKGPDAGEKGPVTEYLLMENLTSGNYEIYADVYDVAGNKKTSETAILDTLKIPSESTAINIDANPKEWTRGTVTVDITTPYQEYILEYNIGGDWLKYEHSIGVEQNNTTVHARLTDGINIGATSSITIQNIDKEAPTIQSVVGSSAVGNVGTITVTGMYDNNQSGVSAISIKKDGSYNWESVSGTDYTKSIEGLNANGTWYIYLKDAVGNISSARTVEISNVVDKVSNVNLTTQNITIRVDETAQLQVTYTGTASSITYTSNGDNIATVSPDGTVRGITPGDTTITIIVYNYDGTYGSVTANIHVIPNNVAPVIQTMYLESKTTNSLTVKVKATDDNGDNLTYQLRVGTEASNLNIVSGQQTVAQNQEVTLTVNSLSEYTYYYYQVVVTDPGSLGDSRNGANPERTYCPGTGKTCEGPFTEIGDCTHCEDGSDPGAEWECPGAYRYESKYRYSEFCNKCMESSPNRVVHVMIHCDECNQDLDMWWECTVCGDHQNCDYQHHKIYGKCFYCKGLGYITKSINCKHNQSSRHECCEHDRVGLHDD